MDDPKRGLSGVFNGLNIEQPSLDFMDEAALEAALAHVPPPRSPDVLLDKLRALGVTPDDVVVDLGCGHGQYTQQIASSIGCTVIALDASPLRVAETRAAAIDAGRVHVAQAVAETLPLRDGSIDLIWCRDMPPFEQPRMLSGCSASLRAGGHMLVYRTFATELLEPLERLRLFDAFSIAPESMDAGYFERCVRDAGLAVVERAEIGGEWREWWEAEGSRKTSANLIRASQLVRGRDAVTGALGAQGYAFVLADQLWGIYQMIGKLMPTVYVLRRG